MFNDTGKLGGAPARVANLLSARKRLFGLSTVAVLVVSSVVLFAGAQANTPSTPTFGTHYKMYSAAGGDFEAERDDTLAYDITTPATFAGVPAGGRYIVTSAPQRFTAPIHPPHGEVLTEAEVYVWDNDSTFDITAELLKEDPSVGSPTLLAVGTTGGAVAAIRKVILTGLFSPETVDSATFSYFLRVTLTDPGAFTGHFLYGARAGWLTSCGELIVLSRSDRFIDTRGFAPGGGGKVGPFNLSIPGTSDTFDFTVTGVSGRDGLTVPVGATAVMGSVTAVDPSANGHFKILPGGTSVSLGTSTVNFNAGINTANAFTMRLDTTGRLRAFLTSPDPNATVHLLIDIVAFCK